MNCPKCGKKSSDQFCSNCGETLKPKSEKPKKKKGILKKILIGLLAVFAFFYVLTILPDFMYRAQVSSCIRSTASENQISRDEAQRQMEQSRDVLLQQLIDDYHGFVKDIIPHKDGFFYVIIGDDWVTSTGIDNREAITYNLMKQIGEINEQTLGSSLIDITVCNSVGLVLSNTNSRKDVYVNDEPLFVPIDLLNN